jgi:hypothetical protein
MLLESAAQFGYYGVRVVRNVMCTVIGELRRYGCLHAAKEVRSRGSAGSHGRFLRPQVHSRPLSSTSTTGYDPTP